MHDDLDDDDDHLRARLADPHASSALTEKMRARIGADATAAWLDALARPRGVAAEPLHVVLVGGMMGTNLDWPSFPSNRAWLDPLEFVEGRLAEKLSLEPDGVTDAWHRKGLEPTTLLPIYGPIRTALRLAGHEVTSVGYDWRKPFELAAIRVRDAITAIHARDADARVALLTHSMGGLVVSVFGRLFPHHADRVKVAIQLGTPFGGTFTTSSGVFGTSSLGEMLADITRLDDEADFRKLAASMPAFVGMLPDPRIFSEPAHGPVAELFHQRAYEFPPLQRWLDYAHTQRQLTYEPALIERSVLIVGAAMSTLGSCKRLENGFLGDGDHYERGDGTVPLRSGVRPGAQAVYAASWPHMWLPLEPQVISAAVAITDGRVPNLGPVHDLQIGERMERPSGGTREGRNAELLPNWFSGTP